MFVRKSRHNGLRVQYRRALDREKRLESKLQRLDILRKEMERRYAQRGKDLQQRLTQIEDLRYKHESMWMSPVSAELTGSQWYVTGNVNGDEIAVVVDAQDYRHAMTRRKILPEDVVSVQ